MSSSLMPNGGHGGPVGGPSNNGGGSVSSDDGGGSVKGAGPMTEPSLGPSKVPPPLYEPPVEPVNGIVHPPTQPPPHRPGRITNQLQFLKNNVIKGEFDKNCLPQGLLGVLASPEQPLKSLYYSPG